MSFARKPSSSNFMAQLDKWTHETVIEPLHEAIMNGDSDECEQAQKLVKAAIREKVLESYRNGQKKPAGQGTATKKGGRQWK